MKPNFRYFKCKLDVEPIKSLDEKWRKNREVRDKKLEDIFDTIPFYEGWRGSESSIWGIVCSLDNPEYAKIKEDKTYKFEMLENKKVVIIGMWEEPIDPKDLPKPFIPNQGERYYSISPDYDEPEYKYANTLNHPSIQNGNCFRTEEDAQKWIDFMKSMME